MSELYEEAVAAIQAGEEARARRLLAQVLKAEPDHEEAWLALASLLEGTRKRQALEQVLKLNPENKRARQQLGLGAVESRELPDFEPAAAPPEEPVAAPPVPEPVPPAVTAPPETDPTRAAEPPEPVPPSEGAVPPAGPGGPLAGSVIVGPGSAAKAAPPVGSGGDDDTVALLLEMVFGLFGALGIGWLYAGNLIAGAGAFFGYMLLLFLELIVLVGTLGPLACLVAPLNLLLVGYSAYRLRGYIRREGSQRNIVYPVGALVIAALLACVLFILLFVAGSFLGISGSEIQQGIEGLPSP